MDFPPEIYMKSACSPCGYCASSYKNESNLRTEILALYALPVSAVDQVSQGDHQKARVNGGRFEPQVFVKNPCLIIERLDCHAANADGVCGLQDTQARIPNQRTPKTLAMQAVVNGQAPQDKHWNGVWHVAAKAASGFHTGHRARSKCVTLARNPTFQCDTPCRPTSNNQFL
jgi:hypothetical protein